MCRSNSDPQQRITLEQYNKALEKAERQIKKEILFGRKNWKRK